MSTRRLTRKEQQAATRERLLRSAARVFARRGFAAASVEEIATDAGFTKGAVYANFASKEELVLAMLDERFAERRAAMERTAASGEEPEDQVRAGGGDFAAYLTADPEWQRLFFEMAAHAARDERFREALVARYRGLREVIADVYARRADELGYETPLPFDQLAWMVFAMGNGFAMEKLLEPDAVPDDLFAQMLTIFLAGLGTMVEEGSATTIG
jgi:AcrR family transcriptional regulator